MRRINFRGRPDRRLLWAGCAFSLLAQTCVAYVAYSSYEAIANEAPRHVGSAMAHARWLLALEGHLHIAIELSLNMWLSKSTGRMEVANVYYDFMHVLIPLSVMGLLQIRSRSDYFRAISELMILSGLALVVFWKFPVAPPRLLPHAGFVDTIAKVPTLTSGGAHGIMSAENPLAAMPSLHVAWAAWSARWIVRAFRPLWVRCLAVMHVVATSIVVIATGNHVLVDCLGGLVALGVAVVSVSSVSQLWILMKYHAKIQTQM